MTTEMTNEEINKVLAERVMGWKLGNVSRKLEHDPRFDVWRDEEWNVHIKPANDWNPTSDLNQAMMIVEKLRTRTGFFTLQAVTPDSQWDASFEYGKVYVADTPTEAICRAAIQLVQEGK